MVLLLVFQFFICMYTVSIILPQQTVRLTHRVGLVHSQILNSQAIGIKLMAPCLKGSSATQYGFELADIAIEDKRLECSHIVEQATHSHHMPQLAFGQVLIEHRQIVAKVEESLHRIALR